MKRLAYLCSLVALFLLPLNASAQFGPYMEGGFGVGGSYSQSGNLSTISASGGYVFDPAFEMGLGVERTSFDNADMSAAGVSPYVSIYPIREGEGLPFSVALNGSYTFQSYTGNLINSIESEGGSVSGNAFSVSGGIFPRFEANESVALLPFVGLGYTRNKIELNASGQTQTRTEELTSVILSLSLEFEVSSSSYFVVTPSTRIGNDHSSFGVSMSFVLPSEDG
jgi:hypothetical protein